MKKIVALCAAAVLCLSLLSACASKQEKQVDLAAFAQTSTHLKQTHNGILNRIGRIIMITENSKRHGIHPAVERSKECLEFFSIHFLCCYQVFL